MQKNDVQQIFGRCNLLNSRQLSFISQVVTVLKIYKEQIKVHITPNFD